MHTHQFRQPDRPTARETRLGHSLLLLAFLPLFLTGAPDLPLGTLVLDPHTEWSIGQGVERETRCFLVERLETGLRVEVREPGHGVVLNMDTPLHLDLRQTSLLVLKYQASGLDLTDPEQGVLVFWGGTPKNLPAVYNADIVCDDQPHELLIDLQEVVAKEGATDEALAKIDLRIRAGNEGPGVFTLLDLRFEPDQEGELVLGADPEDSPVTVRVVDENSKHVDDALVVLDPHTTNLRAEVKTDKDGRATVHPPIPGLAGTRRSLEVTKKGMVSVLFLDLHDVTADAELEAQLYPAQTLSGRVVDETGNPVAKATGEIWFQGQPRPQGPGRPKTAWRAPVFSDKDGRWSCPVVPRKAGLTASLRWTTAGYIQDQYGGQYSGRTSMPDLQNGSAVSTLKRGIVVLGTVTDPQGKPLVEAEVAPGEDRFPSNVTPATKTDAAGAFRFDGVPEGRFVLTATAEGYAPELVEVEAAAGMGPVKIALKAPKTFRFRVVDPEGNPVPAVGFSVDTWREYRTIPQRFQSDAQGLATWDGPDDSVMFRLYARDRSRCQVTASPSTGEGDVTEVVMRGPLKVTIEATDAQTGEPLKEFRVTEGLLWQKDRGQAPSWQPNRHGKPGRDGKWETTCSDGYPFYVFRVDAEGHAPAVSEPIDKDAGDVTLSLKLERAEPMTGTLVNAAGTPVTNTAVHLAVGGRGVQISNGSVQQTQDMDTDRTDEQGRFSFPPQVDEFVLIACTPEGYAQVDTEGFKESQGKIELKRWGVVTGRLLVGNAPKGGEEIAVHPGSGRHMSGQPSVYFSLHARTAQDGSFAVANIPPGRVRVAHQVSVGEHRRSSALSIRAEVEPGQATDVTLGGTGRPVVGKFVLSEGMADLDMSIGFCNLTSRVHDAGIMELMAKVVPPGFMTWDAKRRNEWGNTEEGKAAQKKLAAVQEAAQDSQRRYGIQVGQDGTFRIDNVDPGTYDMTYYVNEPPTGRYRMSGKPVGRLNTEVVVPPLPEGVAYLDEALDLGTLTVDPLNVKLTVGGMAPSFSFPLLALEADAPAAPAKDAKKLSLRDLRGKVVLLHFWGSASPECQAQTPLLKEIWKTYGENSHFAMVGAPLADFDHKAPFEYAKKNGMTWPQAYVDMAARGRIAGRYQLKGVPSVWLIGPDGKILGRDLDGEALTKAVADAMAALGK